MLNDGYGIILNKHPERMIYLVSKPYVNRHIQILELLYHTRLWGLTDYIMEFVEFEKDKDVRIRLEDDDVYL
jgi:hypothetical protein